LTLAAAKLKEAIAKHGGKGVGVLGAARCTNEANYLVSRFARAALGTNNVDFSGRLAQAATLGAMARLAGANGQAATPSATSAQPERGCAFSLGALADLSEADVVLLYEGNLAEQHSQAAWRVLEAVERGNEQRQEVHNPLVAARLYVHAQPRARLIAVAPWSTKLAQIADVFFRPSMGKEAIWLKGFVKAVTEALAPNPSQSQEKGQAADLQAYTPEYVARETGVAQEQFLEAARLFASATRPIIVYSAGQAERAGELEAVSWLTRLALVKKGAGICYFTAQGNSQGACDMGVMPAGLPGGQDVSDEAARKRFESAWGAKVPAEPGLAAWDMPGKVKAMVVIGDDPAATLPDAAEVQKALQGLDFLLVQDSFLTETAKLAHVILPAALYAEEEGTFTSEEGRLQQVRKAVQPPGKAKPHWEILCQLSAAMGYPMKYSAAEDITKEIGALSPLHQGVTREGLGPFGVILKRGETKAPAAASSSQPAAGGPESEKTDAEYPLLLLVDSTSYPWQGDSLVDNAPTLARECEIPMRNFPGGFVEINPEDMQKMGLRRGTRVKVISRRGEMALAAAPRPHLPEGIVLLPYFLRKMAQKVITVRNEAGYPAFEPCPVRIERLA
jgi:predicted molibdopterin-dependent oxidoreductase YjgC